MKAALLALLLAGCAVSAPPPATPEDAQAAVVPLICTSPEQCRTFWLRAQSFVLEQSRYKVRIATDSLIETFGPLRGHAGWAMRVTREPAGTGWERIRIFAGCALTCPTADATLAADFKRYVRSTR